MRDFQPHYDRERDTWSVIAKDWDDEYWWTYLPNVGDKTKAISTASALSEAGRGE